MIKAIIIDDEQRSRTVLSRLLALNCPSVEIMGYGDSVDSGIQILNEIRPDIIFLDIKLSDGYGFDILEKSDYMTDVIFTTAYDQYAIKAFRFSAMDYLIKPIDSEELKEAVLKYQKMRRSGLFEEKLQVLLHNFKKKQSEPPVLSVSMTDSIEYVKVHTIMRCEAEGAYTILYRDNGTKVVISKIIKELDMLLVDYGFYRIHQSHLVNLSCVVKYQKKESVVIMSDGSCLPVSRSRREGFFVAMNKIQL